MTEPSSSLDYWFILSLEITLFLSVIVMFGRLLMVYRRQTALSHGTQEQNDSGSARHHKNGSKRFVPYAHSKKVRKKNAQQIVPPKDSRASRNLAIQSRLGLPERKIHEDPKERREANRQDRAAMKIIKQQSRSLSLNLAVHERDRVRELATQRTSASSNTGSNSIGARAHNNNTKDHEASPQEILDDYIEDFFH